MTYLRFIAARARLRRMLRSLALAGPVAILAAPAPAADPVAGSHYHGQTSQGDRYRLEFRVSADATRVERLLAQFKTPKCERSRTGTQGSVRIPAIAIATGRFSRTGKETERLRRAGRFEGGKQIERYTLTGRFPTAELAAGTLAVRVVIRDRGGERVDSCTARKRITWQADRLGVGPESEE